MVRRLFLTPPALPLTTANRCIEIPDDKAWLGIFNKALLQAAQAFNYEQVNDTDLTPEDVAAVWYDIYVATLEGNCLDCNDCISNEFGLDDDLMYRVEDDVPQFSADDGTTWSDLPPSGGTSPSVPALTATPGVDEDAKRCLAATRATLTIAELYKQTAGKAAVDLYSAFTVMAQFLSDVNRALFRLIWPDYYAVVNVTGLFDCAACEGYLLSEPTLDSEAQDALRCLLYDNATADAGGIVTFDFQAVSDNLISVLGVNPGTVLTLLLAYLGGDGLNRAGNVAVTDDSECADCEGILCENYSDGFNGTLGAKSHNGGWNGQLGGPACAALYENQFSITTSSPHSGSHCLLGSTEGVNYRSINLVIDLERECTVTEVSIWHRKQTSGGGTDNGVQICFRDGDGVNLSNGDSNGIITQTWQKRTVGGTRTNVRYIVIHIFTASGGTNVQADDLQVLVAS